ncbi:MAG TPA: CARDB domain-containing protein [Vicinamibacterales bacterium]|nr:CARDB domain-containing protein [Vicinamibacterales bacterium]
MRRTSFGTIVLAWVAGLIYFTAPASMQGPGRPDRERVNGREVAAREALVRFRDPVGPALLADLHAQADGERIERIGGTGVLRVRSRSIDAAALVVQLSQRPDVLYAEPNYIVRAFSTPNDASFPQLWGLENIGQAVNGGLPGSAGSDIRAVPAWNLTVGSTAHVVGVIDTGVDYTHPDLAPNMWSAPAAFTVDLGGGGVVRCAAGTHGFNAITRACDPMDDQGHGTHVAGTIGASGNDGIGVVGVNWTTQLMGIKFLDDTGSGTIADAITGIRFAVAARRAFPGAADVRILSASWGAFEFSQALLDEITAVQAEDMLFVAAAGNNGLNNDVFPMYPASYEAPNIVSVAATTNTNGRAFFSNYGPTTVDLGAPGVDILSTVPGNSYSFASGTSMATPHVSGAAALVLSRCPFDTTALKDALIGTVQPMDALASVTVTGGRLDVNSAIHSCIAPPPTPDNLTALGGDVQVRLSWASALGATGYTVKRSLTSGGPYTTIASNVKGARYTDSTVVNGTTYYYVVSATNSLGESGDSNEASATPNRPSDLVVPALTAPSAVGAGSTISVEVTTTNQGSGPAPASTTRIYLSANSTFDSGDLGLDPAHAVPALEPGEASSASLSVTIPPDTPAGSRYLIAAADDAHIALESVETNNIRVRAVAVGPDLTISAVSAPSAAAAGEAITISDTVKNQGASGAASSTTTFYLSANATLDASDTLLAGERVVPALAAGASSSGTSTITIPDTTAVGAYYVIAKADGGSAVIESSESNNTSLRSIRIGGDLVLSAFLSPAKGGAGDSISVTDTTHNQGTGATEASVTRFYLSANASFDGADTPLGGRVVPSLMAGASSSGTTSLTIPAATPTGGYYLVAVADADGTVAESLESNNRLLRGLAVGGDLRVSALTAPASAGGGSSIVVSDTTTNEGGGAIGATSTRYYFSANSLLDAQDVALGGRQVPGLGAGASDTGSATVTIPLDLTAGTYYIIARTDADDAAAETQETDNVLTRSIQVGGDLRISAFSAPAKGGAGLSILVSDTTVNQGTATVAASAIRFYLSPNASLDASDTVFADRRAVPALAAGASSSGSTTLVIPSDVPVGSYYLFAKADGDGTVAETQEANNTSLRGIQVGPDLAVSSLTMPAEAAVGSTISVTEATANLGGGEVSPSTTIFFLSGNFSLDTGDTPLGGSRAVGALAAGASSSGPTSLTIPTGTVPGTYYLIAKADGSGSVVETQEANNTRGQAVRIGPDLAVSTASLLSSTVAAGSTATVSNTAVNVGAGVAAPSTIRFYLSSNTTLDAADLLVSGSRDVPELAADATSAGSTVITIPDGTAAGTYYLLAKADADGAVAECFETNNVKVVRSITVTAP